MCRRLNSDDSGVAAVEFALILIPLLLFIFGIIEFGIYIYDRQIITNASRVGARYGILQTPTRHQLADITPQVTTWVSGRLITFGSGSPNITLSTVPANQPGCLKEGDKLTVNVTYPYTFLFLSNFIGPKNITANTTMVCE